MALSGLAKRALSQLLTPKRGNGDIFSHDLNCPLWSKGQDNGAPALLAGPEHEDPMRLSRIRDSLSACFKSEACLDALIVAALVAPVFILSDYYDGFERLYQATRSHEDWPLDELVTVVVFLGLASLLYAIRRLRQSRREIARRRTTEDQADHLARHDILTDLPNRRSFLEELSGLAGSVAPQSGAVFIVDLDRFKPINDLYGHRVGDEVLRVVSTRIRNIVGDLVLIARLGGDEFAILMHFANDRTACHGWHDASCMTLQSQLNLPRYPFRWGPA